MSRTNRSPIKHDRISQMAAKAGFRFVVVYDGDGVPIYDSIQAQQTDVSVEVTHLVLLAAKAECEAIIKQLTELGALAADGKFADAVREQLRVRYAENRP